MADTKTVKFQVYLPEELRTRFKAKCVVSGTTMNEAAVKLIEAWASKDEIPASNDKPTQTQPTSLKELVRQKYFEIMNSGKLGHQRLKDLSFGQKPSPKERLILAEVLGLDKLPED
jgi:ParG